MTVLIGYYFEKGLDSPGLLLYGLIPPSNILRSRREKAQRLGTALPKPKLLSSWTDKPWKCFLCLDLSHSEWQKTHFPLQGLQHKLLRDSGHRLL